MRPLKIKILVPLIVFVLGMCSVGVIVWLTDRNERHEQQVLARLNASAYAERVRNQLLYGVQRTIALQQVLMRLRAYMWVALPRCKAELSDAEGFCASYALRAHPATLSSMGSSLSRIWITAFRSSAWLPRVKARSHLMEGTRRAASGRRPFIGGAALTRSQREEPWAWEEKAWARQRP